jgi:methanogenic corrinoid protein MtbC1
MTAAIRAARRASRNRSLKVMAGGWAFVARPGLVVQVGADATAADAQQAVLAAEALVPTRMLAR